MVTATAAIAGLCVLTTIALAVAVVATYRARAARSALTACQAMQHDGLEREKKSEVAGRLASGAAHDLNDLLTAITGHAELLIASLDPAGASVQDAHQIQRAAASAAQLTRPLRMLIGGHRAAIDVIDVNAVTTRTAAALERMLGPQIQITLMLDPDIARIKVGASHLEEIVLNLGIQARDTMPDGGHLTIATTRYTAPIKDGGQPRPQEYVRMTVADTGGGIAAAAQAKLFEPFFGSEDAGRMAIGLAKVDAIVKQAGGHLTVESAAGAGTRFTIDLPATSESAAPAAATPLVAPATGAVLVVEDEPRVRELIRLVLVREGHAVVAVAGPRAALAELNRQPPVALMLVDVVMPEMDGYDLVAAARTIVPGLHVVVMSGFAPDDTRLPPGDQFLPKPFTVESLIAVVQSALAAA